MSFQSSAARPQPHDRIWCKRADYFFSKTRVIRAFSLFPIDADRCAAHREPRYGNVKIAHFPRPAKRSGAKFCRAIFYLTISYNLYKLLLMERTPDLNASFAALADPTRRAILARLALGEATVNELAKPFRMTQPAISQHLKVLEDAGLIRQRVDGTKRPRRLAKAGIDAMDQWLAMLRKALEKNYDRLDQVLADMESNKEGIKR
jgi:DNA-binding transcriptional ArsR family regulator